MPAATVTVRKTPSVSSTILFAVIMTAKRLKEMVGSAKAISDHMIFEVDSGSDHRKLRYWADDDDGRKPMMAMVGTATDEMFKALGGDDVPHKFIVPTKHLFQCVSAFDPKRDIDVKLRGDGNAYTLLLRQSKKDGEAPDERIITVQPSDHSPKIPANPPKGGYAAVDLARFNKILNGLKQNADVVQVTVGGEAEFEVTVSSKRVQDGWKHATTASGKGTGLFAVDKLKNLVAGACLAAEFGEVYVTDDHPLRIEAVSEDLTAQYWLACRETMR